MAGNPLQYVSRTYNTILANINSDAELLDKPDWWKRMIAGLGDIFSMMLNAEANNAVLRTAFTRQAVSDLLQLIDYTLTEQQTSSGQVLFYVKSSASFPFTVSEINLVALTQSSSSVSSKRFESRNPVAVTAVSETITSTEVNSTTDILTVTREFTTGEKVIFSGASLPSPIVAGTEYWVIKISATQIKIASTLANAYVGVSIDITTVGSGNITINLYSFFATVYQQESKSQQSIGVSDGSTEFQEFDLPDINIIKDTLIITINSVVYDRVDSFVDSLPTDTHYKLIYNTDQSSKIQFGNGTYGIIPPAFDIYESHAVGGGISSNVNTINRLKIYSGSDSNVVGVSNYSILTGGSAPQSIENAKILAPLLLKTRERFVTSSDGKSLAIRFGGFSQISSIQNKYGVLSTKVVGIASGGGNPSSTAKINLQEYLIDRTVLESIDVRVEDTTITSQNVNSSAKMRLGYVYADNEDYISLAWSLFFHESGKEIKDLYIESGISNAVTLINTIFSTSFTSSDYDQIQELVNNLEPREIGVDVQSSDAISYIAGNVFAIDYMTITSPTFPILIAEDEITTIGTIVLSEIT